MRVSRKISIYRAQRSQQGCSLSLGMLRLAEPPTGRARLRSSLKSPRNPITPFETSRVATLHQELYKRLREGARRVIGATAKPLYPIDGKAAGLDRRNPKTSLSEGGGPPHGRWKEFVTQAVEGAHHALPKIQLLRFICFICFICFLYPVCPRHMMFSSKTVRCPSGEYRDSRHRNRFLPFRPCPSAAESPRPQGSSPFLKPCCRTAPRPRRFSERR